MDFITGVVICILFCIVGTLITEIRAISILAIVMICIRIYMEESKEL